MATVLKKKRFTVEDYHRMVEARILAEDDRVELIQGEIVEMPPIGSGHAGQVKFLNAMLSVRLGSRVIVSVQDPVRLSQDSEPQPDLALLRPRPDFYRRLHPGSDDVLLLIEVADTTAEYDRRVKAPLYAEAGIPETWLVDLSADRLEVYRDPSPGGYRDVRVLRRGESVEIGAFPGVTFTVDEVLG